MFLGLDSCVGRLELLGDEYVRVSAVDRPERLSNESSVCFLATTIYLHEKHKFSVVR